VEIGGSMNTAHEFPFAQPQAAQHKYENIQLITFIENIHCGTAATISFKIGNDQLIQTTAMYKYITGYQSESFDNSEYKGDIFFRFFGFVSCGSLSKGDREPLCLLPTTFCFFLSSFRPCIRSLLLTDLLLSPSL
jgi:hypothetical protein